MVSLAIRLHCSSGRRTMTTLQVLAISLISAVIMLIGSWLLFFGSASQLGAYRADINETSVSGVSSGGAMAVQMHVAHSSIMRGVGVTAGVAYDCANSSLPTQSQRLAQGLLCVSGNVAAALSISLTNAAATVPGAIDDPATNLSDQKVWLFSGFNDGTVKREAMDALNQYYGNYVDQGNIFYKTDNQAPHALITADYGATCLSNGGDFVNDCGLRQRRPIAPAHLWTPEPAPERHSERFDHELRSGRVCRRRRALNRPCRHRLCLRSCGLRDRRLPRACGVSWLPPVRGTGR